MKYLCRIFLWLHRLICSWTERLGASEIRKSQNWRSSLTTSFGEVSPRQKGQSLSQCQTGKLASIQSDSRRHRAEQQMGHRTEKARAHRRAGRGVCSTSRASRGKGRTRPGRGHFVQVNPRQSGLSGPQTSDLLSSRASGGGQGGSSWREMPYKQGTQH